MTAPHLTVTTRRARASVAQLTELAVRGLPHMWDEDAQSFVQTMRGLPSPEGPVLRQEGINLRYSAIVALGTSRLRPAEQREALGGRTARDLATLVAAQAWEHPDPGAVALAAWALAEVTGTPDERLLDRLADLLARGTPVPTVQASWMLAAALAAPGAAASARIVSAVRPRLLAAQGDQGIFPHVLPADSQGRWRAHVGCFADQVYPVQALARLAAAHDDAEALAAANRCARRICELQGPAGQWWWHYDVRDGSVVEGFPVYSVHQHAMGPMALIELRGAGGEDHMTEVVLGLSWLRTHPEVVEDLVAEDLAVVWRKVYRREPAKAARRVSALTTSLRAGLHLPGLDRLLPPTRIDHECRPYELGWLLYAWPATDGDRPGTDVRPDATEDRHD